jgi:hypothetical protein
MTLVSQLMKIEDQTISKYLRDFMDKMKLYFNIFFIQYEKFVFENMYGIYPSSDSDSETNEDDEDEFEDEEYEYEDEFQNEEYEEEEEEEEEEFCKENCDCKLCFYFKDMVNRAYYNLHQRKTDSQRGTLLNSIEDSSTEDSEFFRGVKDKTS